MFIWTFFHHKDLGNHLLQLCPKVVKHPVYLFIIYYKFISRRQLNLSRGFCHAASLLGLPSTIPGHLSNTHLHPARSLNTSTIIEWITFSCLSLITRCQVQSQAGIAWLQGRSWLAKMHHPTIVNYSVGQPISILSLPLTNSQCKI